MPTEKEGARDGENSELSLYFSKTYRKFPSGGVQTPILLKTTRQERGGKKKGICGNWKNAREGRFLIANKEWHNATISKTKIKREEGNKGGVGD